MSCREPCGPMNENTGKPWYFCELQPWHQGEHDAPSVLRPAVVAPAETQLWWQVFCAVLGREGTIEFASTMADAAIAEGRKLGRL